MVDSIRARRTQSNLCDFFTEVWAKELRFFLAEKLGATKEPKLLHRQESSALILFLFIFHLSDPAHNHSEAENS